MATLDDGETMVTEQQSNGNMMMQWMEHQAIMLQFLAVHQSALVPVTYFITHYI